MFIAALFTIAEIWKQTEVYLQMNKEIKKIYIYIYIYI